MKYLLHPPCGRAVSGRLIWSKNVDQKGWAEGLEITCFDSGTSAIVVALWRAVAMLGGNLRDFRVWLPAYGCPNVAAACFHLGMEVDFLDLELDHLSVDSARLAEVMDDTCNLAVVIDAFGISPSQKLRSVISSRSNKSRVVHDMCQSYRPFSKDWMPDCEISVVSFGRGKPVSLTVGGGVLTRQGFLRSPQEIESPVRRIGALEFAARISSYNLALTSGGYSILRGLPFLGIGATHFEPAKSPTLMPDLQCRVGLAIEEFRSKQEELLKDSCAALRWAELCELDVPLGARELIKYPLWRVPALAGSEELADRIATECRSFGLTRMYGKTMPEFLGVGSDEARHRWPVAWDLSRRLLSFPSTARVRVNDPVTRYRNVRGIASDDSKPA